MVGRFFSHGKHGFRNSSFLRQGLFFFFDTVSPCEPRLECSGASCLELPQASTMVRQDHSPASASLKLGLQVQPPCHGHSNAHGSVARVTGSSHHVAQAVQTPGSSNPPASERKSAGITGVNPCLLQSWT